MLRTHRALGLALFMLIAAGACTGNEGDHPIDAESEDLRKRCGRTPCDASTDTAVTSDAASSDAAISDASAADAAASDASANDSAITDAAPITGAYATSFPLTENPISESGKWITGKADGLDWNDPLTSSGRATASVLSGNPSRYNDSIARLNASYGADQFAEGVVYRASGYDPSPSKHEVELLLRFDIAQHDAHGYEILWGVTGYLAIVRWNGPLGDYTALYDTGDPGIGPAANGDVLRAEIRGNAVEVFKNGTSVAKIDVTSQGGQVWSTGQPGIGFWPVDGASIEKFGWNDYQAGGL